MAEKAFPVPRTHNVRQVADIINRPVAMVYAMVERGELSHCKIAGRISCSDEHLADLFRRNERPAKVAV